MEDLKKDSADFAIYQASRAQACQGLLVRSYCNSVNFQPNVNLQKFKNLEQYESRINDGINRAKGHAEFYLNTIQPMIVINNNNILDYYGLHRDVLAVLTSDYSEKALLESLNGLKDQSGQYLKEANDTVSKLKTLNIDLGNDTATFSKIVSDLNGAVNGDNGYLQSLEKELGTIQSKIDGAIAGVALSGFAIMGGIFIIVVGAVAEFATAGVSTAVVMGGIGLLSAGIGGEIGSAITLANLHNEKSKMIQDKFDLQAEVKLAQSMSSGYSSLRNQAMEATNAVSQMSNAWTLMSDDLGKLIGNVEKGIIKEGVMRKIWLTNTNTTIARVLNNSDIINQQITGTGTRAVTAPPGILVGDYIKAVAENPEKYTAAA